MVIGGIVNLMAADMWSHYTRITFGGDENVFIFVQLIGKIKVEAVV